MLKVLLGAVHRTQLSRAAQVGEGEMRPLDDQVAVDFVGYHHHAVAAADLVHLGQLLPGPHPAHRVVGGA